MFFEILGMTIAPLIRSLGPRVPPSVQSSLIHHNQGSALSLPVGHLGGKFT
jgi:hypothetical protein